MTIDELAVGMAAEIARTYDEWDIYTFAALTGDLNPAHVDPTFAEKSVFRERIAHGMLTASLVSAVIGMKLPGTGAIYLSQDLRFLRPVRIGDTVTAKVEVIELDRNKHLVRLKTSCSNQRGELLLDGVAVVRPPVATPLPGAERADEQAAAGEPVAAQHVRPRSERRRKRGTLVGQRMTPDPVTTSPDATLAAARVLLATHRIRHLPVVEGGKVVGILAESDIRQASLPGAAGSETDALLSLIRVRETMTRDVVAIGAEAGIGQAARLLLDRRIGGLPVLDGERLVGILTVTDALEVLAEMADVGPRP